MPSLRLLLILFLVQSALVAAQRSGGRNSTSLWKTLNGDAPIVIARGGFSGLFPDSSTTAYLLSLLTSLPDVVVLCDVQLTKDNIGICAPDVKLNNATNIASFFPNGQKSYFVNGFPQKGWFSLDYSLNDLANVSLTQGLFSRPSVFDGNLYPINTVEQMARDVKPPGYWLNIQHDLFFREHNLSMRSFVLGVSRRTVVDYISSPEVSFLTSIVQRFRATRTKLVFRFLLPDAIEPSTNQSYGSLLKNLTFVKTFASGILVPKIYIWPVDVNSYLLPHTSVVSDAHTEGLQVFAADFANDVPSAYNYSYDPVTEALSFIDNPDFSVDGLMSDFPITPSEAIGCFAHVNRKSPGQEKPVIVSHYGASGFYPGSTDLAYQKAVEDGADVIDCSVQMTSDGIPVCLTSIDLLTGTTVAQSPLYARLTKVPDIQNANGVFSFNATWAEIQGLKPLISKPFSDYSLQRNPAYANTGRFMTLEEFLKFAKTQPISGVLLNVKWAAYLAEKQGLDVINAVLTGLRNSSYNDPKSPEITIQSTDSAILTKFKQQTKYKLMYKVDETIRDAQNSTLADIKGFADSVAIDKSSIFPDNNAFLMGTSDIVRKLHAFGLEAYVFTLRNEFVSQAWDFFSDPIVEINSYVQAGEVDGIITDYPGTSKAYKRNSCINKGKEAPSFMDPVQPGALLQLITAQYLPPAAAPLPVLTDSDVAEQPLPPVSKNPSTTGGSTGSPTSLPSPSAQPRLTTSVSVSILMLLGCLLLF
ncbi:glycerophosphodiester phosphodiesterase GDPDL3-like [Aristolochia californica]|uniref:glycerophosphodiester phosphodiesterase GDPDL3-like n=1 Tax=Aristolochia californica TaxID=171875 RepID=UPI0035E1F818